MKKQQRQLQAEAEEVDRQLRDDAVARCRSSDAAERRSRRASEPPTTSTSQNSRRNFVRQYQTRRRATMSSSTSSWPAPYRLARGMSLWARTSTKPRKAMTSDEGAQERPEQRPVVAAVEPREGRRARQHGDEGRGAAQPAPLAGQSGLLATRRGPKVVLSPLAMVLAEYCGTGLFPDQDVRSGVRPSVDAVYRGRSLRSALARRSRSSPLLAALAPAAGGGRADADARAAARTSSAAPRSTCRSTARAPRRGRSRCTTRVQRQGPRKVLIALSGGPGQSAVSSASSFAISLDPALRRYRLAVLDQRGTGQVGRPELPEPAAAALAGRRSRPQAVANCAQPHRAAARLLHDGRHRARHRRAAPGAGRATRSRSWAISYGTHVALQYARAFPEHVDRLILDSIVGPDGPDAFLLDTYRNLPRVLRRAVRARRAAATRPRTRWPTWARSCARINASGPLRGDYYDADGRKRADAVRHARRAVLPAHRGRPQPVPAGGAAGGDQRRAPRRHRAAHAPAAHRPGRPDARARTCRSASTSPPAAPT